MHTLLTIDIKHGIQIIYVINVCEYGLFCINRMKIMKYHTIGTVQKYNNKIVEID